MLVGLSFKAFTIIGEVGLAGSRILVVDDNNSVSTGVKMTLEDMYEVSTAFSAKDAFEHLADNKIDLIVMDIKMPHMNGLDALKEVRKRYPETTVVMLTAYPTEENLQKSREYGASGMLAKPFEVEELRDFVDNALAGKS